MSLSRSLLVCGLLAVAGCGGGIEIHKAGGKVVFKDGTPLSGGVVICEPVEAGEFKGSVRGYIGTDGTFQLGSLRDDDGAPEGKYRIRIHPPEKTNALERSRPKPSVHERYTEFGTSGLEITVTKDRSKNDFTLQVEKP